MVYSQPDIITQLTGALTHTRFYSVTVFVDHYYDYIYSHLMRGILAEETLQTKEVYKRLSATHRARVCTYREENGRFIDTQFKYAVQTCRQLIRYCGVGSCHQKRNC